MLQTEQDIIVAIETDTHMMEILNSARALQLPDWWICAGFVRSKVWDLLHGFERATKLPDVDVVYFDVDDISEECERKLEQQLHNLHPGVPWSVKNQARMHLANNVAPYQSTVDAIAKFPETATALGVKLSAAGEVILTAPCGIEDVLACRVKPTAYFSANKKRMQVYRNRVKHKNWPEKWRKVTLENII